MIERAGAHQADPSTLAKDAPRPRRWADLAPRVASGLVLIALALVTAFVGGHSFALFWLAASAAVYWEWQHLVAGDRLALRFGIGALALAACVPLAVSGQIGAALAVVGVGSVGVLAVSPSGLRVVAASGVAYAAALVLSVNVLRTSFPGGLESILWLFAVVWGTDIMAYFGGRLLGGPKLWPRLSPSKTWSGFLIGIGSGALAGAAVAPAPGPYGHYIAVGLFAAALAQGGDLFESALKRRYGVKDASHIIPGHGGVMDRLDGFVAAAVFAACLGVARFGLDRAGAGLFTW